MTNKRRQKPTTRPPNQMTNKHDSHQIKHNYKKKRLYNPQQPLLIFLPIPEPSQKNPRIFPQPPNHLHQPPNLFRTAPKKTRFGQLLTAPPPPQPKKKKKRKEK